MIKLKIFLTTLTSSLLLLITLCLGSQNLRDRHSINLGIAKTAPFPIGFIVGISLISGVLTGGTTIALLTSRENNE